MLARIYKPTKTTMQSGRSRAPDWILEYEPASARHPDPLTGWTSSTDMNGQVRLTFETSPRRSLTPSATGSPSS